MITSTETVDQDGEEDFVRFERETAGVETEPEILPPGIEPDEEEEFQFPVDDFINPELVAAFLSLPANMMARKTGEDWWRLEEEEVDLLGKSATPGIKYLVDKYLSAAAGPLAGLIASVAVVYGPRVLRQAQEIRAQKLKQERPPSSSTASASSSASADAASPPNSSEYSVPYEE